MAPDELQDEGGLSAAPDHLKGLIGEAMEISDHPGIVADFVRK